MFTQTYDLVMHEDKNAFSALPNIRKFQLMTILAYMWCAIFSLGVGSYVFFGTSVVLHMLVLIGIFFTADIFRKARERSMDHREAYRDRDGGARYDDIWGGI